MPYGKIQQNVNEISIEKKRRREITSLFKLNIINFLLLLFSKMNNIYKKNKINLSLISHILLAIITHSS